NISVLPAPILDRFSKQEIKPLSGDNFKLMARTKWGDCKIVYGISNQDFIFPEEDFIKLIEKVG
ncbi:MAG: hypothetical protein ACK5XN_30190, partial [Bacteroidota bacterium]